MLFFVWCTWMSLSSCFLTPRGDQPTDQQLFSKKKVFRKSALEMNHRTNLVKTKSFFIHTFKRYRLNTVLIYTVSHRKWKQFLFKKHVFFDTWSGEKMGKFVKIKKEVFKKSKKEMRLFVCWYLDDEFPLIKAAASHQTNKPTDHHQ